MSGLYLLALISRWLHVLAAITAVGGTIFMRLALLPAVQRTLTDDQRKSLHEAVRVRWSKIVAGCILFLLASGLYNYFLVRASFTELGRKPPFPYDMLFGIKFLLAMVVFFIASVLSGRSEGTAHFRKNAQAWMSLNLVLAVAIVLISGVLRATHLAPHPLAENAPAASAGQSE